MKPIKILMTIVLMLMVGNTFGQSKAKTATSKPAAAKATGVWINFNGGEDVRKIAVDSINVYVNMAYSKRLIIINKETGAHKELSYDHEISGLAVAAGGCYYFVVQEGIYRYNPTTGKSEGPLIKADPDWYRHFTLTASQNGRFLLCDETLYDLSNGRTYHVRSGGEAVNNVGGVFCASPEASYTPLGGSAYEVTPVGTAVSQFYPDIVSGNVYYCMAEGMAVSPIVPQPGVGVKKIPLSFETDFNEAQFVTRDDEGNFVVSTNMEGIGFGGKSIEDPYRMEKRIASGVKDQWGTELYYSSGDSYIIPDGLGNILFGAKSYPCLFIYNLNGIAGYSEIKGKAIRIE